MNPKLIADLEAARSLVDTPEKWGHKRHVGNKKRAVFESVLSVGNRSISGSMEMLRALGFQSANEAASWSSSKKRTHAEVLAAFDKAIANERSKP
jgi:hypothetical protein